MTTPTPSWINRGTNPLPDWLQPHAIGKRDANGAVLVKTLVGDHAVQKRVAVGSIALLYGGAVHTCLTGEVREYVANLERELAPVPPKDPRQITLAGAEVADRRDDIDDISVRISGERPPTPPPGRVSRPPKPATAEKTRRKQAYPPPKGRRPMIEWIPPSELKIDAAYQRSTDNQASQRLIASIAANFDWRLCTPLVVSRRADGSFVVIDGQHRTLAAQMRGMDDLPCCVFTYESAEEEAKMFVAANRSRKAMNRLDDFHAALAAGDSDAHQVLQLVTDAGLTVARNTSSTAWAAGEIAFTASIASTIKKHGPAVASAALTTIADAFPDQKVVHSGSIFLGLVKVISNPPEGLDRDRLFRAMLKYTAEEWGSFVAGLKGGDTRATAIRDALMMAYEETPAEAAQGEAA